jgi:hypothetical protein
MENGIILGFEACDIKSEALALDSAFISWLPAALRMKNSAI